MQNYDRIFVSYKELYQLPELRHQENVDGIFFRQCRQDYRFVVIAIYDERRDLLVFRDLNKNTGFEFVGGYVEPHESLEEAAHRIVLREAGLSIDELLPIAFVINEFAWNKQTTTHQGIAFIALSRGAIRSLPHNLKTTFVHEMPERMPYQNKKIFECAQRVIQTIPINPPYNEIDSGRSFFLAYILNALIVKKILGRFASRKLKAAICRLIRRQHDSILDASCGNDDLIFNIAATFAPTLCVANDISWKTLTMLRKKADANKVILTNHNVLNLPFKNRFDVVIFKNSLHHIPYHEHKRLIAALGAQSKQLLIMDIEDPAQNNWLGKWWHWYYVHLLNDQGHSFLVPRECERIVRECLPHHVIETQSIHTIKGRYFIISAHSDDNKGEEVELKVSLNADHVELLRRRLEKLGATAHPHIIAENDLYFTAPHRDFIKTRECLRIRISEKGNELTYKGATTNAMDIAGQFWKQEINIPLQGSTRDVEQLLAALNCKKVAEVRKKRETYQLGNQTVAIDEVVGVGFFVEIESFAKSEKDRERARDENTACLAKLGLDKTAIVSEPYRDLVIRAHATQSNQHTTTNTPTDS